MAEESNTGQAADARPKRVVALQHERDAGDGAPRVVAKGNGSLAERILAIAEEHGVPVRHDPDLVEMLASAEVGDQIPVEVYGAVASLLTFLYRMNEEQKPPAEKVDPGT
ncbi:MAG: flagellar biosynthesis protein [Planctomycetota bacterium]|jgi:flagellar biosynthesis protein